MDPLQIIVSAVDEASETFSQISESMAGLASETDEASSSMEESLNEFGLTMTNTGIQVQQSLLTQEQSFAAAAALIQDNGEEIMQTMMDTGATAEEAQSMISEANAEIASSSADTAAAVESSNTASKSSYIALGAIGAIAFNSVMGAVEGMISSAQEWDQTSAIISTELQGIGSSIPLSAMQDYAQQIQDTTLFTQQQALSAEALIAGNAQLAPQYQNLTMLSADLATKMNQVNQGSGNMPAAMKMISNALDDPVAGINQLIRLAGVNLPAATVTAIENMAKMGDTSGADTMLLKALNDQVDGLAQKAAAAPGGGLIQLQNQLTALGTYIGNTLLPALDSIAKDIEPIITAIANWVQAHPKLTEAIVAAMVVFTALIALIGVVAFVVFAVGSTFALVAVGIAAAMAIIVGVVVDNWTLIENDTKQLISMITLLINSGLKGIEIIWTDGLNALWTTAQDIWTAIGNTFKTGIDYIITAINGFINALDALHISIPSVSIPGTKLATPAINLGFSIPDIPMLAEGGFVDTPTLAIIGEAGPEAVIPLSQMGSSGVGGSGTQIIIQIQGGIFPADSGTITQIANLLGKKINQQLKLSSSKY